MLVKGGCFDGGGVVGDVYWLLCEGDVFGVYYVVGGDKWGVCCGGGVGV